MLKSVPILINILLIRTLKSTSDFPDGIITKYYYTGRCKQTAYLM
uniref:Uncharacterized protein n=1 Tax=Myoviridae sp. ct1IL4 TaxID=2825019 RepID=A0A8S5Q805_9CAUD|nr:MAG TPA: hypothetical protein [Myoviridae sp. ct1IL4]DAX20536.1 MAG TPA: hypothetical protein [Caudoviricetes sp.]